MAKYTPGPWRIERGGVVDRSGNVVARVPVENRSLAEVREGSGNTHLIAAAPQLYHVARDVRYFLHLIKEKHGIGAELEHVLGEAEEAIAKVESFSQPEK